MERRQTPHLSYLPCPALSCPAPGLTIKHNLMASKLHLCALLGCPAHGPDAVLAGYEWTMYVHLGQERIFSHMTVCFRIYATPCLYFLRRFWSLRDCDNCSWHLYHHPSDGRATKDISAATVFCHCYGGGGDSGGKLFQLLPHPSKNANSNAPLQLLGGEKNFMYVHLLIALCLNKFWIFFEHADQWSAHFLSHRWV